MAQNRQEQPLFEGDEEANEWLQSRFLCDDIRLTFQEGDTLEGYCFSINGKSAYAYRFKNRRKLKRFVAYVIALVDKE